MPTEKRERHRQNRELKRKQQRREQQKALFKRRLIQSLWLGVIVATIVIIANLNRGSSTTTTTGTAVETSSTAAVTTTSEATTSTTAADAASSLGEQYATFRAQPTACGAEAPPPAQPMSFDAPEDEKIPSDATVTATIATSCGDVVLLLDQNQSPQTVNSFVFLARQGYFNGTAFHRIVPGFVIQGGDPTASGVGGPGYTVPDEFPADGFTYSRGIVAMANAGPRSTGSQFFITLADTGLQPTFAPLGVVSDGFETLDEIAKVPVGPGPSGETSLPLETVYIDSVTIDVTP